MAPLPNACQVLVDGEPLGPLLELPGDSEHKVDNNSVLLASGLAVKPLKSIGPSLSKARQLILAADCNYFSDAGETMVCEY